MKTPRGIFLPLLTRWAGGLRFPRLMALTLALFVIDLFLPDFIPLVDEILLGLTTLLLASWKSKKRTD